MVKTRFRTSLLLVLCGLVAGYSLWYLPAAKASNRSAESRTTLAPTPETPPAGEPIPVETSHEGDSLTIQSTPPQAAPLTALEESLQGYVAGRPGTWGYFVLDLTTGQTAGQNARAMFPAASTIKLPLALYIIDEVAQGRARLDEPITYQDSDWQDGAGYLVEELYPGKSMTVQSLIEVMIRHSDNVAKNMLNPWLPSQG